MGHRLIWGLTTRNEYPVVRVVFFGSKYRVWRRRLYVSSKSYCDPARSL
ncbi:hypothetical protein RSAG8_08917, partial [Rhizoctonia solani AG-8 WAC10335]